MIGGIMLAVGLLLGGAVVVAVLWWRGAIKSSSDVLGQKPVAG